MRCLRIHCHLLFAISVPATYAINSLGKRKCDFDIRRRPAVNHVSWLSMCYLMLLTNLIYHVCSIFSHAHVPSSLVTFPFVIISSLVFRREKTARRNLWSWQYHSLAYIRMCLRVYCYFANRLHSVFFVFRERKCS